MMFSQNIENFENAEKAKSPYFYGKLLTCSGQT